MQSDEDRRIAQQWERHREQVGARHIMHIAGGIVLAMFVFAILGLVDSPKDHREPVQRVSWRAR